MQRKNQEIKLHTLHINTCSIPVTESSRKIRANSANTSYTNSVNTRAAKIGNGKLITVRYRYSLARILTDSDSSMLLREQVLRDLTERIFGKALVKHAVFYMEIQTPSLQQRQMFGSVTSWAHGNVRTARNAIQQRRSRKFASLGRSFTE